MKIMMHLLLTIIICTEEVIQSCGRGPRGEQYASEGEGNDD